MRRSLTKTMPTEAVPRIACCSRSEARHLVGVAAALGDVLDDPDRALLRVLGVERLAIMRQRKVEPSLRRNSHSTSSCCPAARSGTAIRPSAA